MLHMFLHLLSLILLHLGGSSMPATDMQVRVAKNLSIIIIICLIMLNIVILICHVLVIISTNCEAPN